MNGREKRKKRAQRARDQAPIPRGTRDPWGGLCPNGCGEPGPHFVPPSFGDRGFYVCGPLLPIPAHMCDHGHAMKLNPNPDGPRLVHIWAADIYEHWDDDGTELAAPVPRDARVAAEPQRAKEK